MLKRLFLLAALAVAPLACAHAQGQFPAGGVMGNPNASAGQGFPTSLSSVLDRALGSTRGAVAERGASGWGIVTPSATAGLPFVSGGTGADPLYQVLGVVGGGTGLASGTSGGVPCFTSSTGMGSSSALTQNGVVYGGGTGVCPGSVAAGTNGQIFLGVTGSPPQMATLSQDCTITNAGVITCTKTNNVSFAASATTDTTNASNIGSGTLGSARLPSPFTNGTAAGNTSSFATTSGALTNTHIAKFDANGNIVDGGAPATGSVVPAQGRLTLASHTPVMVASQTSQSTLYYDSYIGNQLMYYTGSVDAVDTIASNEVSTAMQASSTGVLNANGVFDVWWEGNTHHNICVATNGSGGGWASDTAGSNSARGTGYSQLDKTTRPYITNANTVSHCYNGSTDYGSITANKLTYLGTIVTDAASAGLVSFTFGASASGGTAARFGVWNAYNRVTVTTNVIDSGANYTYSTATVRQARASAGNQIGFVVGISEDGVYASYSSDGKTSGASSAQALWGFGLDATGAFSSSAQGYVFAPSAIAYATMSAPTTTWIPGVGLHVLSANEKGDGTNANTFDFSSLNTLSASLRM